MINETANTLANHEIVTLAVYLLGGEAGSEFGMGGGRIEDEFALAHQY